MKSLNRLIELFKQSDPQFDIEKLAISAPHAIAVNDKGHNTQIVIKPRDINSGYIGNKTWTYERIDLGTLFLQIIPLLDLRNVTTHEQAVKLINDRFNLDIVADEFIENTPSVEDGYRLVPKAENYEYVGQILFKHALPLSGANRFVLMGFNYPSDTKTLIQAKMYSANLDTIESAYLAHVQEGENVATSILTRLMNFWTTDTWVNNSMSADYNLYGATVKSHEQVVSGDVKHHTLKITLSKECANMSGEFIFRFKSPLTENTTAVTDFTTSHDALQVLPKYKVLTKTEIDALNNLFVLFNLDTTVTNQYTIVYNGSFNEMPDAYLPHVVLAKENVCVVVNGFEPDSLPLILSY